MVSLSSAESELHALVSGACDGICLKHSLQFLTGDDVQYITFAGWTIQPQDRLHANVVQENYAT